MLVPLSESVCKEHFFLLLLLNEFHLLAHEMEVEHHINNRGLLGVHLVPEEDKDFFWERIREVHQIVTLAILFHACIAEIHLALDFFSDVNRLFQVRVFVVVFRVALSKAATEL